MREDNDAHSPGGTKVSQSIHFSSSCSSRPGLYFSPISNWWSCIQEVGSGALSRHGN